jgi:hypothetical protein
VVTIVLTPEEYRGVVRPEWQTLADRIRWLVDYRHTNQRTLGEKAGHSIGAIGGYLSRVATARAEGKPDATMGSDILAGICTAWNVSPAWLLLGIGQPDADAQPLPTPAQPTFADAPSWPYTVSTATALEPSLPAWAFEVVGTWPAPPEGVTLSVGLVVELARVVTRFYPSPIAAPPESSETRVKAFSPPTAATGGSRR